jgi:hypothetical protein
MAAAAMVLVAGAAVAGPNAGGTLIIAESVGTVYTTEAATYCGSATATSCESAVTRWDGGGSLVLNIIAAFSPAASPRLSGVTFGIQHGGGVATPADIQTCGDFEIADATWPDSGTGTAVTWGAAQTGSLTEVAWSAHYAYASYGPDVLQLIPNPVQGANFADDDVPSNVDPIAGLGAYGFYTDGSLPCPADDVPLPCCFADGSCSLEFPVDCDALGGSPAPGGETACNPNPCPAPAIGACCIDTLCIIRFEDDCAASGGVFQGPDSTCDPDPCVPTPTFETTWGSIKANNR